MVVVVVIIVKEKSYEDCAIKESFYVCYAKMTLLLFVSINQSLSFCERSVSSICVNGARPERKETQYP